MRRVYLDLEEEVCRDESASLPKARLPLIALGISIVFEEDFRIDLLSLMPLMSRRTDPMVAQAIYHKDCEIASRQLLSPSLSLSPP